MIEIEHSTEEKLVTIRAIGQLSAKDYDQAIPELEEAIRKSGGNLNAVIALEGLEGMDVGALWKDLKFDVEHYDDFRRLAIVGASGLSKAGAQAGRLLTSAEVEFFETGDIEHARHWAAAA